MNDRNLKKPKEVKGNRQVLVVHDSALQEIELYSIGYFCERRKRSNEKNIEGDLQSRI